MNNKLETIHRAFPFFIDGSFYIATPDNYFEDPEDGILIAVWGDKFRVQFCGPGEYTELIYDNEQETIENVSQWLDAYKEDDI